MASKQLGKLRQWAGEVISLREKSIATEEFRELEKEIEMRKVGAEKMFVAADGYYRALSKKKISTAFNDTDKLMPIDTLGVIMIVHGEEYGNDSALGTALVELGRAHCQVATLQEAFALTFKDTFIASIERLAEEIKEYEVIKKKLESRRLTYDAASNKFEKLKSSKKEKDRREAEDEMERAKQRYDEAAEDVRAHIEVIQEYEATQTREIGALLDIEINFIQQYLNVLQGVKSNWKATGTVQRKPSSKRPKERKPRQGSHSAYASSDGEDGSANGHKSNLHQRADSSGNRTPSRPSSRTSRKRTNSTATVGAEEKEKDDKSKRMSVAGWASSAVGSIRKKNKDLFTELDHEDTAGEELNAKTSGLRPSALNRSKENVLGASPKIPARSLKLDKKVVRAIHNFSGSSDELSFRAGDEIVVINEVLDDWWMGELEGRKGLFPANYVEAVSSKPQLPPRNGKPSSITNTMALTQRDYDLDDDGHEMNEDDHMLMAKPLAHNRSPFFGGFDDRESFTTTDDDDDESDAPPAVTVVRPSTPEEEPPQIVFARSRTPSKKDIRSPDSAQIPLISRDGQDEFDQPVSVSQAKKIPPPPPPRRASANALSSPPTLPERRPNGNRDRANTASALPTTSYIPTPATSESSHGYDTSPFESALDVSTVHIACTEFKQNPYKAKGICSNCFQYHT